MANFLKLVQDTVRESGTENPPNTTSGTTGRVARFSSWVRDAWIDIQNERDDWRWMGRAFVGETLSGVQAYDPAALGIASFKKWNLDGSGDRARFTIQDAALGRADEAFLTLWDYDKFYAQALVGEAAERTGRPQIMAIDERKRLVLHPTPDAVFTIRGRYRKGAQELVADDDVPEMPVAYHKAIMWKALAYMAQFDEAGDLLTLYEQRYRAIRRDMVNRETPPLANSGPMGP